MESRGEIDHIPWVLKKYILHKRSSRSFVPVCPNGLLPSLLVVQMRKLGIVETAVKLLAERYV